MRDNPTTDEPTFRTVADVIPVPQPDQLTGILRRFGSWCLPHDTRNTTCPPGPLVSGDGPLIIVSSIMRSGTHLILDSLFNNFPLLHRSPLFVDLDAYARAGLPVEPLTSINGVIIKTHYPHTPLPGPYADALATLATRACVLNPRRPAKEICRSLATWKQEVPATEFLEIQERFDAFWSPFSPEVLHFSTLLDPAGLEAVIPRIEELTGLKSRRNGKFVMPARTTLGIFVDKALTRVLGHRSPRINTTIGGRLASNRSE